MDMTDRIAGFLGDGFLPIVLFVVSVVALLLAFVQLRACFRHARMRRPLALVLRILWLLAFALLAVLAGTAGFVLRGYRLLIHETSVALIGTRQTGPQEFAVSVEFPDGRSADGVLHGDQWQLDARVIKWKPVAVMMHAPPLFRIDRLSGRYREAGEAQTHPPSLIDFRGESPFDLWQIKQRFPRQLPWVDADYGSSAYMPMADGVRFAVSLSPLGGLVARPADADSARKLENAAW